ncbi:hypothetical protein AJ80_00259 [Polytolypa hystricis UAMH7299]|uniref:Uncharacterized protein n=1 Tax=Polytolypa hystricis (strain UAMH7299) TaxID=1447883 RepID=A0A2B7YV99_POLH7|nr:hypothetical protein AJ80_00259 [Polytolypa hystricis UAMH7299]
MSPNPVKEGRKTASVATSKAVQDIIRERDQTVHRPSDPIRKGDNPIEWLVRIAAASIGFVSGAYQHRQEKKKRSEDEAQIQQSDKAAISQQFNEAIWELDDAAAAQESTAPETDSQPPKEPSDLAETFLKRHSYQSIMKPDAKLALPVILTQRQPKKRARGFIRAYSPVLADALEPNPWLYALNLAGLAGMVVPEPSMMLLAVGVGIATDAAMEVQSRFKSNKLLDSINAEFFIPRGLLCLVVTWKPEAADGELMIAVNFEGGTVKSYSKTSLTQNIKDIIKQKISSEEGLQRLQLFFPSPDETAAAHRTYVDGKKKNALDHAEVWLDEYMDRRSQAKWLDKNRDLPTADLPPRPGFRSRYADPNYPAASGDIIAFLTGGNWQFEPDKIIKSKISDLDRDGKDDMRKSGKSETKSSASKSKSTGGFMNLLQRDVLYLFQ